MADRLVTIEIDGTQLREALEGQSLKAEIKTFVRVAARVSADSIAREAAARLQRQLGPQATGTTAAGIQVQSDRTGWGWVVVASRPRTEQLPFWLETGTVHMRARPFFHASAQLEEAAHYGRVQAAIQAALAEHGLGDQP